MPTYGSYVCVYVVHGAESLVTSFAKVLEKTICDRLIKYIQINNIIVVEEFGFRSSSAYKAAFKLIKWY
jgi:hypothetical protein